MAFFAGVVQVLFTTEAQRAQRFLAGDLIGRRYGFRGGCGDSVGHGSSDMRRRFGVSTSVKMV